MCNTERRQYVRRLRRVRQLMNEGLSDWQIAKRVKLDPDTIWRFVLQTPASICRRCPECGHKVVMPCLVCQARARAARSRLTMSA